MEKIVLDVQIGQLKENSVIRYNSQKKVWEAVDYADFNEKLYKENLKLKEELKEFKEQFINFKKAVNEKLESYHDVLQILTKE